MTEPDPSAVLLDIEVAIAERDRQRCVALKLPPESTVEDALHAAQDSLKDLDVFALPVGVFGELCEYNRRLKSGDRVELYRPLERDPKRARRERAAKQKVDGVN